MEDVHAWSRGLRGMLLGRDPFEIAALHAELAQGTVYHARRGLGVHAASAVDVALHGALVIPHCWKTGVTAAASRHFQAATPNAPYVEMFHPDLYESLLRRELTGAEPEISDGRIALPTAPGLGIEIDEAVVERYRIDG